MLLALTAPRERKVMGYTLPPAPSDEALIQSMHIDLSSIMQKGAGSPVKSLKSKVRAICAKRSIRLTTFFASIDSPMKSQKRMTKTQFKRALTQAALTAPCSADGDPAASEYLTIKDLALLCKRYEVPSQPDLVDWGRFVDQIDKQPETTLSGTGLGEHLEYGLQCPRITEDELPELSAVLDILKKRVDFHGLMIDRQLRDFDASNSGHITEAQFLRSVDSMGHGSISAAQGRLLARAYMHPVKRVINYKALHADVTPETEIYDDGSVYQDPSVADTADSVEDFCDDEVSLFGGSVAESDLGESMDNSWYNSGNRNGREASGASLGQLDSSRYSLGSYTTSAAVPSDLTPLEMKLAAKIRNEFIEVASEFQSMDPFKKGTCTAAVFRRGVVRCFNMAFSASQLHELVARYTCGKGLVCYSAFAQRLHAAANAGTTSSVVSESNGSIYNGNSLANGNGGASSVTGSESFASMTSDYNATLQTILDRIRTKISSKRVLMKPAMRGFDPRNEQHITREQFARVLSMFDLLPAASSERDVLYSAFAAKPDFRRVTGAYIEYGRFLTAVDTDVQPARTPASRDGLRERKRPIRTGGPRQPDRDVRALMQVLQALVARHKLRPGDAFRDFDVRREGRVTRDQFARGLSTLGLIATQGELATLVKAFEDPCTTVRDVRGEPYVKWPLLADHLEASVFGPLHLESAGANDDIDSVSVYSTYSGYSRATTMTNGHAPVKQPTAGRNAQVSSEDLSAALQCAADQLAALNLDLAEFIAPQDRLRSGEVPFSKLTSSLSIAGATLPARHLEALRVGFASTKTPEHLQWRSLVVAIEAAMRNQDPTNANYCASADLSLGRRRHDLLESFTDFDRFHVKRCSPAQFLSVLSSAGFNMTRRQGEALCKAYSAGRSDVSYLGFCRDVQPQNTVASL